MFFNNNCCNNAWGQEQCCMMNNSCGCDPIIEPAVERCVERNFYSTVEHICPINTKIINNHIIEHKYRPEYTCSEENIVTNIDPGCCNNNF